MKRVRHSLSRQSGLSLIEAVLALGLLAFIGVGILKGIETNARATRVLDEKVTADNLASDFLETIKRSAYSDNYTSATVNITVPFQYSVVVDTYGTDNYTAWVQPSSGQSLQKIVIVIKQSGRPVLSVCTYRADR